MVDSKSNGRVILNNKAKSWLHVVNVYQEVEFTVKDFLSVQKEGNKSIKRKLVYYNPDVIISDG